MGAKGLIGDVHARFTADTEGFKANVGGAAKAIRAVGKAAEGSAKMVAEASATMEEASRAQTKAHDRALRAWRREQEANALAAARASQAAAAAQEMARAQEMAALKADILSRAEEQVGLSSVPAIRGMQMMARTARETMGQTATKIAEVAERAELSADGVAAAFGGLGAVLGGGLAVSFAAHTLDNLAELNVRLEDLREKTGMSVQELAGLRLIAQSKGLDFSTISRGLARLATAIYNAKRGSSEAIDAFGSLGITMQEIESPSFTLTSAFYKIASAAGKYHSVVLTTATAQKLFGRGGRELVPILQAYGAGLKQVVREKGADTRMTDKSAAAAHRWLVATTDLSAEVHGAMIPALEGLVAVLPFVEAGLRGLEAVFTSVFEGAAASALSVTDAIGGLGYALGDLARFKPGQAWHQVTGTYADIKSFWRTPVSDTSSAWHGMQKDWHEGTHPPKDKAYPYNLPVTPQGMLTSPYGPAQRKLTAMERKHPVTAQQVIAYWQGVLAQTRRGTADYIKISNLLASYAEDPNRAAYLGGGKSNAKSVLAQLRSGAAALSAGDAYAYWSTHAAQLPAGSPGQRLAAANAGHAWTQIRRRQSAYRAQAIRENLMFHPFLDARGVPRAWRAVAAPPPQANLSRSSSFVRGVQAQSHDIQGWLDSQARLRDAMARIADAMVKMRIAGAVASGAMTKLDAATAMAALHQQEYSQAMSAFKAQIRSLQVGVAGAGMTPVEKRAAIARVRAQQVQFQTGAMQVAQRDAMATGQWRPGSTVVAVRNALDEFVLAVRDTSGAIASIVTGTVTGVNRTLSGAIMAHSYNSWEWRRHILNAMSGQMRSAGARGLDVAMSGMEGGVLKAFGFGPKVKRGDSPTVPIYTMDVGGMKGAGSAGAALGKIASATAKHGVGGFFGSIFQGFFANGGTVLPGMPAIVGERGPELFVPHSAGRIVPNHQLVGNVTHHYHIDARGATDPAAVEMAVHRAIGQAAPHIVAASVQAVHEHHSRIPTNRRF